LFHNARKGEKERGGGKGRSTEDTKPHTQWTISGSFGEGGGREEKEERGEKKTASRRKP